MLFSDSDIISTSSASTELKELVLKTFPEDTDDYNELYANLQIRNYIINNEKLIKKDQFIIESISKIAILYLTEKQQEIISEATTLEEQYSACIKASKLKEGFFFEIKGDQSLEKFISEDSDILTFREKMHLLLDILMGGALLDRSGIIQRDFSCDNIQINIKPGERSEAYIIDLGKAIHRDIVNIFEKDESKKREYCCPFFYSSPPEAYKEGFGGLDPYSEDNINLILGDKYNGFNIGLLMFSLFFDKDGQEITYKYRSDEDLVDFLKNLFKDLDNVVDELNRHRRKPYNEDEILLLKEIMEKLLNPDFHQRQSAETVGRELYKFLNQ